MAFVDIINLINKHEKIALFSHQKCDGDAVGSCIALKLALEKLNKKVEIFIQNPIHRNYEFMGTQKYINKGGSQKFDLAIALDCPNTKRFGIYEKKFKSIKASIAIDHHDDFENFANLNFCDPKSSSVCLIIYQLIKEMGISLDPEIALCLYSGMATDTGRFNHGNLDASVFSAVSNLFNTNFDYETANYMLFKRQTKYEFELFRLALNKVKLFQNGTIAVVQLVEKDFLTTGTTPFDTYKIVDIITGIEGVELACVLSQSKSKEFLVSIRSMGTFSAQRVAQAFGGGGHVKASGCKIFESPEVAYKQIIDACKREILKD